jgi:thiamine biosynthesis lipoprotein
VGIEEPDESREEGGTLNRTIVLQERSLATSGNYKKFYVEDGKKYTHIIDPHTGLPAKNSLLSASVVAPDCMTADAYATAFMVMGLDSAKAFLADHQNLQLSVYFIYDEQGNTKTYISPDFPPVAR